MKLEKQCILILSGDKRQEYLYEYFLSKGYNVHFEASFTKSGLLDIQKKCQLVVAPIPLCSYPKALHIEKYPKLEMFIGGCVPKSIYEQGTTHHVFCYDYMSDKELTHFNAIATAEGTIAEALTHHPLNLYENNCLVLGYGACGSALATRLKRLGAHVTVCVRRFDAWKEVVHAGLRGVYFDTLEEQLGDFSFIFNTVPSMVLPECLLKSVAKDSIIIDIASSPGGVDFEVAKDLGLNASLCLGLPGIYAPKSSAIGMGACIERIYNSWKNNALPHDICCKKE